MEINFFKEYGLISRGVFIFVVIFLLQISTVYGADPLIVYPSPLIFGNVFAGEIVLKDVKISLAENFAKADYKLSLISQGTPSICDFITIINKENENDLISQASLLKPNDYEDFWQLTVSVPSDIDVSQNYSSCSFNATIISSVSSDQNGATESPTPSPDTLSSITSSFGGGVVLPIFLNQSKLNFQNDKATPILTLPKKSDESPKTDTILKPSEPPKKISKPSLIETPKNDQKKDSLKEKPIEEKIEEKVKKSETDFKEARQRNKNLGDIFIILGILVLLLAYYLRKREENKII